MLAISLLTTPRTPHTTSLISSARSRASRFVGDAGELHDALVGIYVNLVRGHAFLR
jgi:hypothetical protein